MAMNKKELREVYLTLLEEDIIKELASLNYIDNRNAMELFYKSKLCEQINSGKYGIEYMDYKYLANDLMENESELLNE